MYLEVTDALYPCTLDMSDSTIIKSPHINHHGPFPVYDCA